MARSLSRFALAIALATVAVPAHAADDMPDAASLRAAIRDLAATFPGRYPDAAALLARLDRTGTPAAFDRLRREALLANPLVSGRPIVFVVRPQYRPDHHNSATMFQTGEINAGSFQGPGALKRLTFRDGNGEPDVKTLLDVPQGVVRDPEVSFDGRTILFSMRHNRADDYHLYEIAADGTGLRQLTRGEGVSDIDPIYLADGRILFTSTREPKYCMCNRHIMGNLFTMDADGKHMEQIGHSTLHEGHASLLSDGRVLYDRWEYVDRNFGNAQGLWTCNPDGTNHVIFYGNNTGSPGAKIQGRAIPDAETVVCTFSSCHDRPWGALAILDRRLGTDGREPVVRTWPPDAAGRVGHGSYDAFKAVTPKYQDPYPLSSKYFLCSRMTGQGELMGIYLLDVFGNEMLLHVEEPGCFDPMPLEAHTRPPVIPSRVDPASHEGYFYVSNVYEGNGMDRIPPHAIKRLRVVVSPEKRFWTRPNWNGGTGAQAPGMAWNDFNNKRILGTVPVEPDGSAYFAVPADTFVYFQALDERGMMLQSMRSGTTVRPGERVGCIGCHEHRQQSVGSGDLPQAMRRAPSPLRPWYGPPRNFGYLAEVQGVFDRFCVSCHDYGTEGGKKLNLAGDLNACFNTSYVELRAKKFVRVIGAGPPAVQMPMTWGSHASPLVRVLLQGHGKPEIDRQVKLDAEGFDRIVTWVDLNAPYYPEYAAGAYRDNLFGRCPIDQRQVEQLDRLTGLRLDGKDVTMVNFTRPELSPCLAVFADPRDPRYGKTLEILRSGVANLAAHPRPDKPGYRLDDPHEMAQQSKYDALHTSPAGSAR